MATSGAEVSGIPDNPNPAEIDDGEPLTIEERARLRGWKGPEEYTGDPRRFRDAETFMRISESDARVAHEENRRFERDVSRLTRSNDELRREIEGLRAGFSEMRELAKKADQRGYERARAELKIKQRDAAERGDMATFDEIESQVRTLDADAAEATRTPPPPATQQQQQQPPPADPAIAPWVAENPWFQEHKDLNAAMIGNYGVVQASRPDLTTRGQLEEAKRRTAVDFPGRIPGMEQSRTEPRRENQVDDDDEPERRARPTPSRSSAVPADTTRPRRDGDPWSRIADRAERADAQAGYQRALKGDPDMTIAEYLAIYLGEENDVIALHARRKKA